VQLLADASGAGPRSLSAARAACDEGAGI